MANVSETPETSFCASVLAKALKIEDLGAIDKILNTIEKQFDPGNVARVKKLAEHYCSETSLFLLNHKIEWLQLRGFSKPIDVKAIFPTHQEPASERCVSGALSDLENEPTEFDCFRISVATKPTAKRARKGKRKKNPIEISIFGRAPEPDLNSKNDNNKGKEKLINSSLKSKEDRHEKLNLDEQSLSDIVAEIEKAGEKTVVPKRKKRRKKKNSKDPKKTTENQSTKSLTEICLEKKCEKALNERPESNHNSETSTLMESPDFLSDIKAKAIENSDEQSLSDIVAEKAGEQTVVSKRKKRRKKKNSKDPKKTTENQSTKSLTEMPTLDSGIVSGAIGAGKDKSSTLSSGTIETVGENAKKNPLVLDNSESYGISDIGQSKHNRGTGTTWGLLNSFHLFSDLKAKAIENADEQSLSDIVAEIEKAGEKTVVPKRKKKRKRKNSKDPKKTTENQSTKLLTEIPESCREKKCKKAPNESNHNSETGTILESPDLLSNIKAKAIENADEQSLSDIVAEIEKAGEQTVVPKRKKKRKKKNSKDPKKTTEYQSTELLTEICLEKKCEKALNERPQSNHNSETGTILESHEFLSDIKAKAIENSDEQSLSDIVAEKAGEQTVVSKRKKRRKKKNSKDPKKTTENQSTKSLTEMPTLDSGIVSGAIGAGEDKFSTLSSGTIEIFGENAKKNPLVLDNSESYGISDFGQYKHNRGTCTTWGLLNSFHLFSDLKAKAIENADEQSLSDIVAEIEKAGEKTVVPKRKKKRKKKNSKDPKKTTENQSTKSLTEIPESCPEKKCKKAPNESNHNSETGTILESPDLLSNIKAKAIDNSDEQSLSDIVAEIEKAGEQLVVPKGKKKGKDILPKLEEKSTSEIEQTVVPKRKKKNKKAKSSL